MQSVEKRHLFIKPTLEGLEDDEKNIWIGAEGSLNRFAQRKEEFTCYRNGPSNFNSLSGNVEVRIGCEKEDSHRKFRISEK